MDSQLHNGILYSIIDKTCNITCIKFIFNKYMYMDLRI